MPNETALRRLERRAKALLLNKEIPPAKMEVVRTIIRNREISREERYRSIITLVQACPDKKQRPSFAVDVPGVPQRERDKKAATAPSKQAPEETVRRADRYGDAGRYTDRLREKYRKLRLFRRRYLIHANNRLGIGIQKRLIPNARLMKVLGDVVVFQERILARLSDILQFILRDENIQDPVLFNYLRVFRRWMLATPLIEYQYSTLKWMDRREYESDLKNFVVGFFSFQKLSVDVREQMLQLVDLKLREQDDLKKEVVNQKDFDHVKRAKEKNNLAREKKIYEYMMLMRSFLPVSIYADSMVSAHLKTSYGIPSYPQFLVMLMEVLVFWKEIEYKDIESFYGVRTPAIDRKEWDYNIDELRKAGKDAESRKRRRMDGLKRQLAPYEELYRLLELKIDGQDLLMRAFEDQWRLVDKRQKEFDGVFEEDFLRFLDGCINYFNNCFVPLIDGTVVYFEDRSKSIIEGRLFFVSHFSEETGGISDLLGEMNTFVTMNPSLVLRREEVRRIMQGKMRSMAHVERFVRITGELFYGMGKKFQRVYDAHQNWVRAVGNADEAPPARDPVEDAVIRGDDPNAAFPVPFHDCRISGFENRVPLSRTLSGRPIISDLYGGVLLHMTAFCFQLAFECMNESLLADLEERKNLVREIKDLSGREA